MCVRASSSNSSGSNNNSSGIQGPAPSDAYRVDGGLALELCCVLFFKTILTVFSFGLMVPAGIFIPALTVRPESKLLALGFGETPSSIVVVFLTVVTRFRVQGCLCPLLHVCARALAVWLFLVACLMS